jgi:hypothetical protein
MGVSDGENVHDGCSGRKEVFVGLEEIVRLLARDSANDELST